MTGPTWLPIGDGRHVRISEVQSFRVARRAVDAWALTLTLRGGAVLTASQVSEGYVRAMLAYLGVHEFDVRQLEVEPAPNSNYDPESRYAR
jgi:predicted RNA-binding protein